METPVAPSNKDALIASLLERVEALMAEAAGGLTEGEVDVFVREAVATFRWHGEATVDAETDRALKAAHRLIADLVCFKPPQ